MNERLEKLKNQAVDYAEEVFEYHGKDYREIVMEKFAELIVRECADAMTKDKRLNDVRSAVNGCVRSIYEYFGIDFGVEK